MSPTSSRAAIRFVVALFLAQTFVNAVAVPHPHIHKVLDPRQVVSLPVVERQEQAEPESKNVFDAIVDTLKGYNGWQVFQDFFRKLFGGGPPPGGNHHDNGGHHHGHPGSPSVSVSLVPVPVASESSVDVISVIASIISDVASATEPIVIIPTPTESETDGIMSILPIFPVTTPTESETDGIMSILPIFPITTAIDLSGALETVVPTEFLSAPETTEAPEVTAPIVIVIPDTNSTDVVVIIPTDVVAPIVTAPIVTAPIVTGPVEVLPTATGAPFPIDNGTVVAPIPGTDVPVVISTGAFPTGVLPTDISSPVEANISASASAVINATVSVTSTVDLTITLGTGIASAGTGLPITISESGAPFANATAITPTLVLVTGTGDVGTIAPTISIEPISAPFANTSVAATAVAPIGTAPIVIIGTGVVSGTSVVSVEPVETVILSTGVVGTGIVGTGTVGTGEATAVAPIDTAAPFPNTTAVEIVIEPTFVLPTGTAPGTAPGTISAAPASSDVSGGIYVNTTTTTVTNIVVPSLILSTGIETAVAPIGTGIPGTIVLVPGPGSTDNAYFPNITITVNATAEATLSVELPIATELPIETSLPLNVTLAPVPVIETEFPASPIETVTAVGPIITEPIPSDAPVIEFPGLLALRSICRDPTIRQLTIPLLNRFYGPSAYPSLFSFPGCQAPNARQTTQAPGLLNCTALGAVVQTCQSSGRRVLLSVRGDSPAAVAGNQNFGDPTSYAAPWGGYSPDGSAPAAGVYFPNLFDARHVPSAFALTLFSLFGEGRTERADLRPLGPDTPAEDGITWVTKPLGEEVVVDGFDVQVPREWQGTYQEGQFDGLVTRLAELNDEAWTASGGVRGGPNDLGAHGKSVVFRGWNKKRSVQRVVMVGGFEVVVE